MEIKNPQKLFELLKDAVNHLADGNSEDAKKLLDEQYKKTLEHFAEGTDVHVAAEGLHGDIRNALRGEAKRHIKPYAKKALENLDSLSIDTINQTQDGLHKAIHEIDHAREYEKNVFAQHEAELYKEKGKLGYAWDLTKRRWSGEDYRAGTEVKMPFKQVKVKGFSLKGSETNSHMKPNNIISNPELKEYALEDYGKVKPIESMGGKIAFGAVTTVGVGMIVHGGYNMVKAFTQPKDDYLELEQAANQHKGEGANWTRLVAGIGEAAVGAALAYRMLTGRNMKSGVLEGEVEKMMSCEHSHGVAH